MKVLYIDLDGVVADFLKAVNESSEKNNYKGRPDKIPGIYKDLVPIKDSVESINQLFSSNKFDIHFLSAAPWDNPDAWTHKRLWVEKYFGNKSRKKLILSHRKDLQIGDFLIDDNSYNGTQDFKGKWIHYGSKNFPDWSSVLKYLLNS